MQSSSPFVIRKRSRYWREFFAYCRRQFAAITRFVFVRQWRKYYDVLSAVKSFYFLEEHDALGGLEKVGTMLDKARYRNSLSSKLTAHLQRINRTDLIPYIQYDTKHGKGG